MPKKTKTKSAKIVKFQKPKTSKNITLDKLPNGDLITSIEHYKSKDYERMFTIDDVLLLIPKDLKKRTWANWRELNNVPGVLREDKLGPEYVIRGKKIYRIKLIWILRYIKGLNWEPSTQVQVSATQSDEIQLRSSSSI
ncbi:hypothetical protein N8707_01425 [Candidatus Pelagibacter sp.]|nr:hypothetical protein [Candidatus Pelagibacter sp.]